VFQIHHQKYYFNQRLLQLREKKLNVICEVKTLTSKLFEVQKQLPSDLVLPVPQISEITPEEMPEKYV